MKNNEINGNKMKSGLGVDLDEALEPNEAEPEVSRPESDDEPAADESVLGRLFRSVREALEIEEQEIEPIDVEEGYEWEDEKAEDNSDTELERSLFLYGDLNSQSETDDEFLPIVRIFEHRATKQPSEQASASEKSAEEDDPIDRLIRRVTSPEKEEIKDDFDASPRKMAPTIISLLICLLLMGGVAYYILCAHDLRAVMSVEQLEVSANAYRMTYTGEYGFDKYLANGGADDEKELSEFIGSQVFWGAFGAPNIGGDMSETAGSAFNAENSITLKGTLMGTAYNSDEDLMLLTLVTRPKDGYDSVSTVNMSALGYASYSRPSLFNRFDLLAAPYLPVDGMNECGLCVALLALPGESVECIDTERPDLIATTAVRLVLDMADDVDMALALLEKYDVYPCFGAAYHLALSDYSGRSVVVEWVDGEMVLVEQPYAANGILAAPTMAESPVLADSAERSERMSRTYDQYNGAMTQAQVFNTMEAVSSDGDGWIAVFDTYRSIATYCFGSDHDTRFTVSLD